MIIHGPKDKIAAAHDACSNAYQQWLDAFNAANLARQAEEKARARYEESEKRWIELTSGACAPGELGMDALDKLKQQGGVRR